MLQADHYVFILFQDHFEDLVAVLFPGDFGDLASLHLAEVLCVFFFLLLGHTIIVEDRAGNAKDKLEPNVPPRTSRKSLFKGLYLTL